MGNKVYYSHLHGIQVLHLVYLYPAITVIVGIGTQGIVGKQKQVFKINQFVLLAISGIGMGITHLAQHIGSQSLSTHIIVIALYGITIVVCMVIDIYHSLGGKRPVFYLTDSLHHAHIVGTYTVGMQPQFAGMTMDNLMHEVGKIDNLCILSTSLVHPLYLAFFFVLITGQNTQCIIVVDNRRFCLNQMVLKQKF